MLDEQRFFAWLDGELTPEESAEVERRVAEDPQLARLAEEHRAMADGLRQSFDAIAAAPVPERLRLAADAPEPKVVHLSSWRRSLARPFATPLGQLAAMAATLVLGLALGTLMSGSAAVAPVELRGGTLIAAGAVDQALDTQLASAGAQGGVRIGLTFRDASGSVCRTFETAAASGLACNDDGDWRLRGLFAAPKQDATEYRMAAGQNPLLLELVDATISGEPFDAAEEAEAKRRAWR